MSVGGWFGYWAVTLVLFVFSAGCLIDEDRDLSLFAKWWFRATACLSVFLVGFGLVMAVMGR